MGYKDKPRYNVISMRVSDDERKTLQKFATRNSLNISGLMRMAVQVYTLKNNARLENESRTF